MVIQTYVRDHFPVPLSTLLRRIPTQVSLRRTSVYNKAVVWDIIESVLLEVLLTSDVNTAENLLVYHLSGIVKIYTKISTPQKWPSSPGSPQTYFVVSVTETYAQKTKKI